MSCTLLLVTYDVNTETNDGKRRLRKAAKICTKYGQRVQNSVFECVIDSSHMVLLKRELEDIIDSELDSLRLYNLGNNYKKRVEHIGAKPTMDLGQDTLIV